MVSGEVRGPLAVRSCAVGDQSDVRDLTVLLPTVARREMSDVLGRVCLAAPAGRGGPRKLFTII